MEANRFGNKDIEEFAHFFRLEIERITDKISREEIIPAKNIIEIIQQQGKIARPENFLSTCMKKVLYQENLLAEGKNPVPTFML